MGLLIFDKSNKDKNIKKQLSPAKECVFIATFVAIMVVAQLTLSFVPGVEVVTVLFVTYACVMGVKRAIITGTIFSVVRQIVFGFYPTVLVLYIIYYNLLSVSFGFLGKKEKDNFKFLMVTVIAACVFTVVFTMIDNVLTPLWYGYSKKATQLYFYGSLPFMLMQVINVGISVLILFFPLKRVFIFVKKKL
jgi:hypothetical protein